MRVPLNEVSFGQAEIDEAMDSFASGFVTMGKKVEQFEKEFADYHGVKHAVMVNSGSSANLLAVAALIEAGWLAPGDEVLVPALTWSTGVAPLLQHGLVPVFIDADEKTLCMNMIDAADAVSGKTRAMFPAHILGNACDMDTGRFIADRSGLAIIEDCCEALGTTAAAVGTPKKVGTFGIMGTYSFYFSHHITTIEGGMVVTDDGGAADLCRSLRSHGWTRGLAAQEEWEGKSPHIDPRFLFIVAGYNLRPTEINAAFGLHQLPRLDERNEKRAAVATALRFALRSVEEVQLTEPGPGVGHTWFGFPMFVDADRDLFFAHLRKMEIETRPIVAGNLTRHPFLQDAKYRCHGALPVAQKAMEKGVYLPCHPEMTDGQILHIVDSVKGYFAARKVA